MTIITVSLLSLFTFFHPYYVSVFEVQHHPKTKTFQVAAKIFMTDIEKALMEDGHPNPYIGTQKEAKETDAWIEAYMNEHFQLTADGNRVRLSMLGKEIEADAVWCYLESKPVPHVDTLTVKATVLMDEFPTQTNLVHFTIWGTKTSVILRKGRTERQLFYEEFH